ncbi:tetratricopeptide repeat protein [Desulfogranum marinum]|uniref:YfgM family protein n=1 Tax=Desulfogranum marinum TaxID=453220 RepID=UPI0029C80AE5|nr:tetratricopeptide repeat protein [Desulfogranum marinum]
MAEQNAFDRKTIEMNTMTESEGLLEQFNLPPAFIKFLRNNSKIIWIIIACVAVVVVAASLYDTYRAHTLDKAASSLDAALQNTENAEQMLKGVVEEFSSTPSATWAKIALVKLYQEQKQYDKAVALLVEIEADSSLDSLVKPLVTYKLAALYEEQGAMEKALGAYTVLSGMQGFEADAYKAMGRVQESLGNKDQAVSMYQQYIEQQKVSQLNGQDDPAREVIESRLKMLQTN